VHAKIQVLSGLDVRQIVNLCVERKYSRLGLPLQSYSSYLPETIRLTHFPLSDGDAPSRSQMSAVLDYLDECLWSGTATYLHCRGGKRRTSTVVACFLVRHELARGEAAIEMDARLRSSQDAISCQLTPAQSQLVLDWRRGD
jgi:protein-tyrosine phosphatase